MTTPIKLVVGLGNPGKAYTFTRHNIGRRVLERLESDPPAGVFLFIPDSFMNVSGPPTAELLRRKGLTPQQLLAVVDDFELPLGILRLRPSGSSGGHNGLKSIFEALGTQDVPRLRIGVGPVPEGMDPADFVLGSFNGIEKTRISEAVLPRAEACVRRIIESTVESAMNEFNNKPLP